MQRSIIRSLLLGLALVTAGGCGSGSGGNSGSAAGAAATGGSAPGGRTGAAGNGFGGPGAGGSAPGGTVGTGGTVGPSASAGNGGAVGTGGAIGMGGGAAGTGEGAANGGGGAGGQTSAGGESGAATGGQAGAGAGVGNLDELYEAEAIPPNQVSGYARADACTPKCATPLTVGANCCSGTGEVTWIVSQNGAHPAGWMQFNAVSAPAEASYDVTFWYHCGDSDTYGDGNCGGQMMTEPKQTGCRPHVFTVNGTTMPGAYHFPCFPGSWATMYAATVSLPLKAGMNTIKVAPPPPRDAVDVDAIEVVPPGKGHAPRITANTSDLLGE